MMRLPTATVRAYYAQHTPAPARPAAPGLLLFPKSSLLQSVFASLLPYLELEHRLPEQLLIHIVVEAPAHGSGSTAYRSSSSP